MSCAETVGGDRSRTIRHEDCLPRVAVARPFAEATDGSLKGGPPPLASVAQSDQVPPVSGRATISPQQEMGFRSFDRFALCFTISI
jgi:hypothetical protein